LRIRLDETAPVDSKSLRLKFLGKGQNFTTLLGGGLAVFLFASAAAQDGYYGVGHDKLLLEAQKKRWPRLVLQLDGLSPDPKSHG